MKTFTKAAKEVLKSEAKAIEALSERLGSEFEKTVNTILSHNGKIIICGVGKSGWIGRKIAATLTSTGTPAVFLHACEAVHGDLGIYEDGDPAILISNSGATSECLRIMPVLRSFGSTLIALVGNPDSPMARNADITLDASFESEGDPLGIVPTTSAAAALAMGDAIACALIEARGFSKTDFAKFHPAGQLGRNLTYKVSDMMQSLEECPLVSEGDTIRQTVIAMTKKPLGAACVVDENLGLLGLITDGDIRRMLQNEIEIDSAKASEIMTRSPITIEQSASLGDAVRLMEERKSKLSVLPVLNSEKKLAGLIRLHDIYTPQG